MTKQTKHKSTPNKTRAVLNIHFGAKQCVRYKYSAKQ